MKKITFLIAFFLAFVLKGYSQTLNQSAGWPNPAWTITGSYSTDPIAFESDPRTTASFAFDDDDAGSGHEDNIAAESPVIDLTAAFAAGEKALEISVQYGYRYLADDVLRFEYWNADTSTWVPWGANIPGNYTATVINDNFCTIPKTTLTSEVLSIFSFTPTQLAGFKYRIYYNDSLTGADYNYGFCFSSPTLKSIACVAPTALTVVSFSSVGANITWGADTAFEYVLDNVSTDPTVAGTNITTNSFSPAGLNPSTVYYFHLRTMCSSGPSAWRTVTFTTRATPPANDNCSGAIALTMNADLACAVKTSGTLVGATDSLVPDTGAGTPDDDVWYSFVATTSAHTIALSNVAATPTDLVHEVFVGGCNGLTSLTISDPNTTALTGLTVGTTYYVRVFSFATGISTTTFDICVGTSAAAPAAPANNEPAGAVNLTVNPALTCTATTAGTTISATASAVPAPACNADGFNDDVWYTFTATNAMQRFTFTGTTTLGIMATTLYTGTPGSLVEVPGSCKSGNIQNFTGLTVGTVYYARVYTNVANPTVTTAFTLCVGTPPAPPANDNCAGAVALTVNADLACAVKTSGTLVGATDSGVADTGAGVPDDDVWYSFVATATAHRIVLSNVAGAPTDLVHEIMSGTCGTLTSLLISDPNTSTITGLTIGSTYYVRVFSLASGTDSTTTFDLCVGTIPPPPANDNCSGAVALTVNTNYLCGVKTPGTLQSATASPVPDNGAGTPDDDVWYSFVATATTHRITLSNVTGTPTDMVHEILSGTCASLTSVLVSDADTSNPTGLVIGNTYYVRVFSYETGTSSSTTFNVCVGTLPGAPANDDCPGAIALTVNADLLCGVKTTGTLQSSTASAEPDNGAGTPDDDVWYTFVATATTHRITLSNVTGTPTDLVHEVLGGTCGGGLVSLSISDPDTSTVTGLVPGNTYYLRVFGYGVSTTSTTIFDVCVGTLPGPPANDSCADAITLTVNNNLSCTVKTPGTVQSATDSGEGDNGVGTPDDDVWYKFVATSATHTISITDVAGTPTDLVHEILEGTCGGGLISSYISDPDSSMATGLIVGTTYYVRVFTSAATPGSTTFNVCVGTPPPPPANDNCSGAIALTMNADLACGVKTSGTLQSATDSLVPDTGAGTPDDDVWYRFVATTTAHTIALSNVAGTPTDLVHEVFVGGCNGLTSLAITDPNTTALTGLTVGTTYYVRVFSYATGTGSTTTFDICVGTSAAAPAAPANNEPAGAINLTVNPALTCTATTAGTTVSATASAVPAPACNADGFNDDVWYTFTATNAIQRFTFTGVTPVMATTLYTGTPGSLVEVPGSCTSGNTQNFTGLTVGTVYYARVYTNVANPTVTTAFTLCVGTPPPPPANDNCPAAVALTPTGTFGSVTDGTNVGATASSTETAPGVCLGYSGGDVWYSVVVPASGSITIETGNSSTGATGFDSVITVYSGTCGALVQVGCDDDSAATGSYSQVILTGQTPGATLYARVYEYSNDSTGSFGISAYHASLGTPSFDDANFRAYPNPVVDVLNLSYTQEISNVSVFNLLGQQVISKTIGATDASVDMSNLAGGTYLVKVAVDNQVKTIKVVKK